MKRDWSFICHAYDCAKSDTENETCEDNDVFVQADGRCGAYHPVRTDEQVETLLIKYDKL